MIAFNSGWFSTVSTIVTAIAFVSSSILPMHLARASDDDVSIATQGLNLLPASFSGAPNPKLAGAQFGQILVSCQNGQQMTAAQYQELGNEVASYFGVKGAKSNSGSESCKLPSKIHATFQCKPAAIPAVGSTCDAFRIGGILNRNKLQEAAKSANEASCSLKCKQLQLQALNEEMKCLSQQSDQLVHQLNAQVQKAYVDNIQRFQKELVTIKSALKDRELQADFVRQRLGGAQDRGEDGWVKVQADIKQAYDGMNAEIAQVLEGQNATRMQHASVVEQTNSRRATLTSKCFRERVVETNAAYYSCPFRSGYAETMAAQTSMPRVPGAPGGVTPGGAGHISLPGESQQRAVQQNASPVSVTAYEYLLCRHWQEGHRGRGGQYEAEQGAVRADAMNRTTDLKALLDRIFGEAPSDFKVPTKPEEIATMASQPVGNLLPEQVNATFGAELQRFDGNGLGIRSYVVKTLASCDAFAKRVVDQERNLVNNPLGMAIQGGQQKDRQLCAMVEGLFDRHSQLYTTATSALTGQNIPMDVSRCRASSDCRAMDLCKDDVTCRQRVFNMQTSCLKDMRRNMEGILRGNTPNSNVRIAIPANEPKLNIVMECSGLNGCVRKMQNVARQITQEQERTKQFKQEFVMKANQNVDAFTRQMAVALSGPSQQINNRLKELNSALAQFGSGSSIKIEAFKAEKLERDEDGLYRLPENAMRLIGGSATPPLLDVSGNNFADSLSGLDKANQKIAEDQNKVNEVLSNVTNLQASCPKEGLRDRVTKIESLWASLEAVNCAGVAEKFCFEGTAQKNLMDALAVASEWDGTSLGMDTGVLTNIESGLSGICTYGATGKEQTPQTGQMNEGYTLSRCNQVATQLSREIKDYTAKVKAAGAPKSGSSAISGD